jgi:hypothetical protein
LSEEDAQIMDPLGVVVKEFRNGFPLVFSINLILGVKDFSGFPESTFKYVNFRS